MPQLSSYDPDAVELSTFASSDDACVCWPVCLLVPACRAEARLCALPEQCMCAAVHARRLHSPRLTGACTRALHNPAPCPTAPTDTPTHTRTHTHTHTHCPMPSYVYAPLPPATSYGHRAEAWNPDKWLQVRWLAGMRGSERHAWATAVQQLGRAAAAQLVRAVWRAGGALCGAATQLSQQRRVLDPPCVVLTLLRGWPRRGCASRC
jgi:hypothetical protein